MARRRGLATALQAALSAAAGGFAGLAQQQEAKRQQERQRAMDLMGILQAGGRLDGSEPAAIGPAPTGIGAGGKLTSKAAPPPPPAQETAIDIPGIGRVMMGGPTPSERRAMARSAAEAQAEQGKEAKKLTALQDALSSFTESQLPSRYRQAVSSGAMSLDAALDQARGRVTTPTDTSLTQSRAISASNDEADVYVQAANGDAAEAERRYKTENPRGTLSSRYFQAAATRFRQRSSAATSLADALRKYGLNIPQE